MNEALDHLARRLNLADPSNRRLRLEFGHACVLRVKHLLEEPAVLACLTVLSDYLDGSLTDAQLEKAAADAARLANQHQGSKSIDGCGHAAVSATYAVANALSGKALQTAEYAAYAARCALVRAALGPGMGQDVLAADLVVQRVEAVAGFGLRFRV